MLCTSFAVEPITGLRGIPAWLLACAFIYTQGRTLGLLVRIDADALIGWSWR